MDLGVDPFRKGSRGWKDLITDEDLGRNPQWDPLFKYVFTEIPEGFREVPDFRVPPEIMAKWKQKKLFQQLRTMLHHWRLANDEEYRTFVRERVYEYQVRASRSWDPVIEEAEEFYTKLVSDPGCPPGLALQLTASLAVLKDPRVRTAAKYRAIKDIVQARQRIENFQRQQILQLFKEQEPEATVEEEDEAVPEDLSKVPMNDLFKRATGTSGDN